jgi:hypothetical protein
MELEIEKSRKVLQNIVVPVFTLYSDLKNYQDFLFNNFESINKPGHLIPGLMAAKLRTSKEDLMSFIEYVRNKKKMDSEKDINPINKLLIDATKYAAN